MEKHAERPAVPLKARHVFEEFVWTLWYLRAILVSLLVLFLVLSMVMQGFGGPVETANRTPTPLGQTFYFCAITALTIGYGDIVPTTTIGRLAAIALGAIGILMMGLLSAAAVRGVQEASRRADAERAGNRID